MRRTLASLLLAVSVAGVCLPWFQAQSKPPACCRSAGQHHCSTPLQGDGFHAAATCCPYHLHAALTSQFGSALPASSFTFVVAATSSDETLSDFSQRAKASADIISSRGPPFV